MIAGAGADAISVGDGTNTILGDEGRLEVLTANGTATGTTVISSQNAAVGGIDTITIGSGRNVVVGGAAADTISVNGTAAGARATVVGDNGTVTLSNAGVLLSVTSLDFASGDADDITLTSGTNTVIGGVGGDKITAGGGINTVLSDDGQAQFFSDGSLRLIESINLGNGGIDTVTLAGGVNTVIAGAGADAISVRNGTNTILGDEGSLEVLTDSNGVATGTTVISSTNASVGGIDTITIGSGRNVVVGGAAADTIAVNGTADGARATVVGDNGTVTLSNAGVLLSVTSSDFAYGDADTITLSNGINTVIGGAGADVITATGGVSIVLGDDGQAQFLSDGSVSLIETIGATATVNSVYGGSDTIRLPNGKNIVFGGDFGDDIVVGTGAGLVVGDHGRATLNSKDDYDDDDDDVGDHGRATLNSMGRVLIFESTYPDIGGDDRIKTGAGDNTIVGGPGSDIIDGGADFDSAAYDGDFAEYTVTVTGATTTVKRNRDGRTDTLTSIAKLQFMGASGRLVYRIDSLRVGEDEQFLLVDNQKVTVGVVTTGGLSTFDRNPDLAQDQFDLIFTPDYNSRSGNYRLSNSNPGQFQYNLLYDGTKNTTTALKVNIPYPFVFHGGVPIHVYDDVIIDEHDGELIFTPRDEIADYKAEGQLTVVLNDTNGSGGEDIGDFYEVTINGVPTSSDGFVYLNIHLG